MKSARANEVSASQRDEYVKAKEGDLTGQIGVGRFSGKIGQYQPAERYGCVVSAYNGGTRCQHIMRNGKDHGKTCNLPCSPSGLCMIHAKRN